jgi:tRNA modification GTPase
MIPDDTIAAIATPPGVGGIAVVRISGSTAINTAGRIYQGWQSLTESKSHRALFGTIIDPESSERVDSVIVNVFRSPHSYTGEDTVEISCHGGILNSNKILELVLRAGARLAEPGEFTRRAFLNGKMDLTQVEAVADLIHAKTEAARRSSANQVVGLLSDEVKSLRSELIQLCSLIEIDLDFAEENLIDIGRQKILSSIHKAKTRLQKLLETYTFGHLLREGAYVNIVGPPNVGKSSILNALLRKNRAIVSDVPGTTRDYIEEGIDIDGLPVILRDTAGLRESKNTIEAIGIGLTEEHLERADLNMLVVDSSVPDNPESQMAANKVSKTEVPFLVCLNKIDKSDDNRISELEDRFKRTIRVSAKTFVGIDKLRSEIRSMLACEVPVDSPVISRMRHKEAISKSLSFLNSAEETVKNGLSNEFASVDVRSAVDSLGEIIGEVTSVEVLNNIFSNFCIGK